MTEFDETKLLSMFDFSTADVVKCGAFDYTQAVHPGGQFIVSLTGVENANEGLPDFFFNVSFEGMTFVAEDPDKAIIRTMFHEAWKTVINFTAETCDAALELARPAKCVGVIRRTSTSGSNASVHTFRIDCVLVLVNFFGTYQEHALPIFELKQVNLQPPESGKVTYIRFTVQSPCGVQRIRETVSNGVKTTEHMVAFGEWEDRESLTYYPINQPVPVEQNT